MKLNEQILMGVLMVTAGTSAYAERLTPDEALERIMQGSNSSIAKVRATTKDALHLAYPIDNEADAPVYIFTPAKSTGFVMLAADDALGTVLLGYSDNTTFDANNIPEGLKWYMDALDESVRLASESGAPILRSSSTSKPNIDALLKTQWNQDSPYNDQCPIINNQHAVTGCVATAFAQIMKHHEWPKSGVWSASYAYNGTTYSLENFDNATLDWSNMTNTYGSSSTQIQKNAVARLMHAVGIASQMNYGVSASGTVSNYGGLGLLTYFDYDNSMTFLQSECYAQDQWEEIIYEQLSSNLPIYYSGQTMTGSEAHAFVLDGYTDGYYHINWGWGGLCDGLYDLSVLYPSSKGIGGGSGDGGYSYSQSMIINIQPQKNTAESASSISAANFYPGSYSYTRSSSNKVTFYGRFHVQSLKTQTFTIGIELVNSSGSEYIASSAWGYWDAGYLDSVDVSSSKFPTGTYDIYPVYKIGDGDWIRMPYDTTNPNIPLKATVTSSSITFEEPANTDGNLNVTYIGWSSDENLDVIYINHAYDFTWAITADGDWNKDVAAVVLINGVYTTSNLQRITLSDGHSETVTFNVKTPSQYSGKGTVGLYYNKNGSLTLIGNAQTIELVPITYSGSCNITNISFSGGPSNAGKSTSGNVQFYADYGSINVDLICTSAPLADELIVGFFDTTGATYISQTRSKLAIAKSVGETFTMTFDGPFDGLDYGTTYLACIYGLYESIQQLWDNRTDYYNYFYLTYLDGAPAAKSVLLNSYNLNLEVGQTGQLTATVYPDYAVYDMIEWSSSDESIVTVAFGTVTAVGMGTATITASAGSVSAKCNVTVEAAGIASVLNDRVSIDVDGSTLIINGLGTSDNVAVYLPSGQLVYSGDSPRISLSPRTLYILKINEQAIKFTTR